MSYLGASLGTIGLRFGGGFLFVLHAPAAPPRPERKSCAGAGRKAEQFQRFNWHGRCGYLTVLTEPGRFLCAG